MPSCTSRREPAQQTWPWLNQIASTTPFDRAVEIGVVEHDERRLAAELERQLLAGAGGRLADDAADFGRAGEGDLVDAGCLTILAGLAVAGDDVDDALRQPASRRSRRTAAPSAA
jgi:hypothetical protein